MSDTLTPSQTIGPFFRNGLEWAVGTAQAPADSDQWLVQGIVTDGHGQPVSDAMLEIWQPTMKRADAPAGASGFQRVYTDDEGRFAFMARRAEGALDVAYVTIFARGLLAELRTRLYPGGSAEQLASLGGLERLDVGRLSTLVASSIDPERRTLAWSVRLQGDGETVFFSFA